MVAPGSSSSDMAAAPPSLCGKSLTPSLEPSLPGARSNLGIESPIFCNLSLFLPSMLCMSLICNLSLFLPQPVTSIHSNLCYVPVAIKKLLNEIWTSAVSVEKERDYIDQIKVVELLLCKLFVPPPEVLVVQMQDTFFKKFDYCRYWSFAAKQPKNSFLTVAGI
jgi:hypothetical protein